jgi:hypothetical protein
MIGGKSMSDDSISRQAAIDAMANTLWHCPNKCYRNLNEYEFAKGLAELGLKSVPSAQTEPCEYYALCRHGRDENKLRANLGFCEYCNEDSDGYVKPLEKNCHAFIHFGMDGWELSLSAKGWHGSAKIRYCPMCGRDLLVK